MPRRRRRLDREAVVAPAGDGVMPVNVLTLTGVGWLVVVPMPRFPNSLSPQAHTVPSALSASEWSRAPAIAIALVRPDDLHRQAAMVVVPSPSWPQLFKPQHHTLPSSGQRHRVVVAGADALITGFR